MYNYLYQPSLTQCMEKIDPTQKLHGKAIKSSLRKRMNQQAQHAR